MLMENDILTQPLEVPESMSVDEMKRITYLRAESQEYLCLETYTKEKSSQIDWKTSYLSNRQRGIIPTIGA